MKPGYKITLRDLETPGNIEKLRHDKVSRETLSKEMYRLTEGASTQQRNELMSKLHDRSEK